MATTRQTLYIGLCLFRNDQECGKRYFVQENQRATRSAALRTTSGKRFSLFFRSVTGSISRFSNPATRIAQRREDKRERQVDDIIDVFRLVWISCCCSIGNESHGSYAEKDHESHAGDSFREIARSREYRPFAIFRQTSMKTNESYGLVNSRQRRRTP